MRQILGPVLTFLMIMNSVPAVMAADDVASQIAAMPTGTKIEVRLKSKEKLRGSAGAVSNSGFTLTDSQTVAHQIAFDDVASVKQIAAKPSHVTRNVLIIVGVGVAVTALVIGIHIAKCGPLGCNSHI
jgi:hypothetical protein